MSDAPGLSPKGLPPALRRQPHLPNNAHPHAAIGHEGATNTYIDAFAALVQQVKDIPPEMVVRNDATLEAIQKG